jgi:serine O-acetyltransferase
MTLRHTLRLLAGDVRERCRLAQRRYGVLSYAKLLLTPPALAVILYRGQHWLHTSGWRRCAEGLRLLNIVLFTTDISSGAVIGEHFILYHANGINICGSARIGKNVHLVHHSTIATGPRPGEEPGDQVVIEDDVVLGCGVRVLGNLTVGTGSFLGAGAVVTASVPAYSFYLAGPGETAELD